MIYIYDLKPYTPVEAYCIDCHSYHLTYDEVSGNSDFPIARCPQCEANWNEYLNLIKENPDKYTI